MKITIKEVAHHRNGVSGEPFYIVTFTWRDADAQQPRTRSMIGILFESAGSCAVLDVDETQKGNKWGRVSAPKSWPLRESSCPHHTEIVRTYQHLTSNSAQLVSDAFVDCLPT